MKAINNLRTKSNEQLNNRLNEIRTSLRRAQGFNHAERGVKNPNLIHKLRKERAQILTILNQRSAQPHD